MKVNDEEGPGRKAIGAGSTLDGGSIGSDTTAIYDDDNDDDDYDDDDNNNHDDHDDNDICDYDF